jgi:hypothetical protein
MRSSKRLKVAGVAGLVLIGCAVGVAFVPVEPCFIAMHSIFAF